MSKAIYHSIKHFFQQPKPLEWYVSAPLPIFAVVAVVLVLTVAPRVMDNLVKENAVETAVELTQTLQKIRNYYAQHVLGKVSANTGIEITHLHKLSDNSIPIPATFLIEMTQTQTHNDKLKVQVTSPYPFESRKERVMNNFQQYAWQQLTANPQHPVSRFDTQDGKRVVKVALPDRLTSSSCVSCHNSHRDSSKKDWQLGDVRGIVEITVDVESSLKRANRISLWITVISLLCLTLLVLFNLRLARKIVRPLSDITSAITALSERRIISTTAQAGDYVEVKALGNALINFQQNEVKRQALEDEVHKLAYFDTLTDLPNRASMLAFLKRRLAILPSSQQLNFILLSIEKFNEVNDTLGYSIGDKVLVELAKRTQQCCPDTFIARFNSTEFAIAYLNGNSQHLAEQLMQQLQQAVAVDNHQLNLTIAIGITQVSDNTLPVDEIIAQANIALHQAEQLPSDKLVTYTPALSSALHQRVTLTKELQYAIDNNELVPYFQPQLDLVSNQLVGAEVLLRWIKADGTMVAPFSFIPIAETSGLIIPIGRLVLAQACQLNKQWQDQGFPPFRIAVNVSGVQFDQDNMLLEVQQALQTSGLAPKWLELEVTETALMADIDLIIDKLCKLRQLGIELAIDDFGTGYSSLSYLKRLPIDRLKVDQAFIRHLTDNEDDLAIVKMILNLGHSMQLKVLAEGVEDEKTKVLLQSLGCDEAQGYHYAKPMPADAFEDYLKNLASNQGK